MISIIKHTFQEMFNKKALLLVVVLTIVFLSLYGIGLRQAYKHMPSNDLFAMTLSAELTYIGLYFANFIMAFLVILLSAGGISGDIESGAMQTLLVKPISRWEVVLGKYIGISILVILYSAAFFSAVITLNLFFGAKLALGFSNLFFGWLLFILGPLALLGVTIYGSSALSTLNTGIISVMLYGFAIVGGVMEQIGSLMSIAGKDATWLINVGIISSLIMPTDVIFRKMNSLLFTSSGFNFVSGGIMTASGLEPSPYMMGYVGIYVFMVLFLAIKNFKTRDI